MITKSTMTVIWERPALDGGSDIDGYYLEKREKKSLQWFKVRLLAYLCVFVGQEAKLISVNVFVQVVKGSIRDTRQKVTNLVENNEYQYRVCAVNKAGAGNYSEASDLYRAYDPIGTLTGLTVSASFFTRFVFGRPSYPFVSSRSAW